MHTRPTAGGDADLGDVVAELRRSNRLLAVLATRGLDQKESVLLLDAVGFQPRQIAAVLGVTANRVRVALHRARKASQRQDDSELRDTGAIDGDE